MPSLATPQPACCFRSTRSGLQQVRVLRKLMPGKGFYMDVLCYLLKAWKRCAVPAVIASCCHGCSYALLASCLSSHTVWCSALSSCISCRCLLFASQSRAPQGRLKSPKFKSGLYTKFHDQGFLQTLERRCEAQICKAGGFVRRSSGYVAAGQLSKGLTRVRASGMLIPTAGLLHDRRALRSVTVSIC